MSDYLNNITEGQTLDSIQKVYLTHSTIMKELIDSDSYDAMMIQVVKDITEQDSILEKIKALKKKQRLYIGEIIYIWANYNWRLAYPPHITNVFGGMVVVKGAETRWATFNDRFSSAFGNDVFWECRYTIAAKKKSITTTKKKNGKFNIIMRDFNYWCQETEARMIVKYREKEHSLEICYVEYDKSIYFYEFSPKVLRPELFKGVKEIALKLKEQTGTMPKIICKKEYQDIYKEAMKRKYLEEEKQEKYDLLSL